MAKGAARQKSLFVEELPELRSAWEVAAASDEQVAQVVFDLPLREPFSYSIPDSLIELVAPGSRIQAPFGGGNRTLTGFCVATGPRSGLLPQANYRLKPLFAVLDREPLVGSAMLELTRWIADRYLCGWGQVLNSVVPAGVKSAAGTREFTFFQMAPDWQGQLPPRRLPPKQMAVWTALQGRTEPVRVDMLSELAGCGIAPIHALRDAGWIVAERVRTDSAPNDDDASEVGAANSSETPKAESTPSHRDLGASAEPKRLNADQRIAAESILTALRSSRHETILLHGVTGSGKTEVYMHAIAEAISYGRQVIVLVPEISLTPQTIRRFRARFSSVAVLHSHLTDAERHRHWRKIASGSVQVVVGARSAIFAPTRHLGLIIIDEEHETSFKQDSVPRYHAREVARRRAEMEQIPLVLGTATPTLESYVRAMRGLDRLISMPRRVERRPLPPVVVVDVRNDPVVQRGGAIGRALATAMDRAIADGGQVILFLNVRGFAPVLWCRACGTGVRCPYCDITLTWHKQRAEAVCHSCDRSGPAPERCPKCQAPNLLYLGVGTERLEAEVKTRFPNHACLRMDSDTMQRRGSHDTALEAFRRGEVQILLGTQMIAKGLDFPNVTLVGVIDADTLLHQPDLRASERTFQLLAQVAGRTGRGEKGGRVLVQTSNAEQPAITFAARHDFDGFARVELEHRRSLQAPPFAHLIRVVVRSESEPAAAQFAELIRDRLRSCPEFGEIRLLGPAPCVVTRLQGKFRYHLQLTATALEQLQSVWRTVEAALPRPDDVEFVVDVDPVNLR